MNVVKRVAKNTALLTLADLTSKILSLVLVIYITRYLGAEGFGKYSFALSFVTLFIISSDFGLTTLATREIARDHSRASMYLGNTVGIKFFLSTVSLLIIFVTINVLDYPSDTILAVYILGGAMVFNSFTSLFRGIFRAFERMEYESLTVILERLLITSFGILVLYVGYGLIELVLVILGASIFNLALTFFLCSFKFAKPKLQFDRDFWGQLIKTALPFGLVSIFITIYIKIDVIMLSLMKGNAVVGWYSAAAVMISSLTFISTIFMSSLFPVVSRFYISSMDSLVRAYEKSFKYLFILALPIAVGTTILAERFVLAVYGENFANSIIPLKILVWALLLILINHMMGTMLRSINRQKLNAVGAGAAVLLNITLNLLLIPPFSLVGAAIATAATESFIFLFYFRALSKHLYRLPLLKNTLRTVIACVLLGMFVYSFQQYTLLLVIPASSLFYLLVLYAVKGISKDDVELIKRAGGR